MNSKLIALLLTSYSFVILESSAATTATAQPQSQGTITKYSTVLKYKQLTTSFPFGTQAIYLDVIDGRQVSATDPSAKVSVQMTRDTTSTASTYAWTITMTGVNGSAFLSISDPKLNQAPTSGYTKTFQYTASSSATGWQANLTSRFIMQITNPAAYAKVQILFDARDKTNGAVTISSFINTTGSNDLTLMAPTTS